MSPMTSLAARNLTRNRRRTVFTFAAIAVGTAMLVFLNAVNSGVVAMLVNAFIHSQVGAVKVYKAGYFESAKAGRLLHLSLPYDDVMRAKILAVPGVRAVTGRIVFAGLITNGEGQSNVTITAVDPERESDVVSRQKILLAPGSTPLAAGDTDTVILNKDLAAGLKSGTAESAPGSNAPPEPPTFAELGALTLVTATPGGRNNSAELRAKGYAISLFPGPGPRRQISIPLALAQSLLGMEGKATEITLALDDMDRMDEVVLALRASLGSEYEVHDWKKLVPDIADISFRQDVILGIASALLVTLVVFGICNTMLMCVRERTREIGTMTALGSDKRQVMGLFMTEAGILGLLGGLFGVMLGVGIALVFNRYGIPLGTTSPLFADGIRPIPSLTYAAVTLGGAGLVSLMAGLVPAWKAAGMKPVDALGHL